MEPIVEGLPEARLRPGFCLVEPDQHAEKSTGGIIYSEGAQPWSPVGTVVNMGAPRQTTLGAHVPAGFEVGDRVLFERFAGHEFKCPGDRNLVYLRHENVLATVEDDA